MQIKHVIKVGQYSHSGNTYNYCCKFRINNTQSCDGETIYYLSMEDEQDVYGYSSPDRNQDILKMVKEDTRAIVVYEKFSTKKAAKQFAKAPNFTFVNIQA